MQIIKRNQTANSREVKSIFEVDGASVFHITDIQSSNYYVHTTAEKQLINIPQMIYTYIAEYHIKNIHI